jgi:chromate transporter
MTGEDQAMSRVESIAVPSVHQASKADHGVTLGQAFRVWTRVAALSFGGPAGQIAVMHRIIVEEKKWISDNRFLHALNYCMLLPGPEAQQLAIYIGWLMHRTLGGIMAGGLFIVPGIVSIMALSYIYAVFGNVGFVTAMFFGLKAAVLAIVLDAVVRVGKRALKNNVMRGFAAVAFVGIFFLGAPFPAIVLGAGVIGFFGGRAGLPQFKVGGGHGPSKKGGSQESLLGEELPAHANPTVGKSLRVGAIWLCLWLAPVIALLVFAGGASVYTSIAVFFSKMALVTFGGAYAVLAYVAQEAVQDYHWLKPGEMLDGLGMAETTPGPLIMVLQFVGFMAAYRAPGALSPVMAGTLGGLLATWVTFTPCFLWIFLGAPFIEQLRGNKALAGALSAITAAVVGVILNLAVWFAIHTAFHETKPFNGYGLSVDVPILSSLDPWALSLALGAVVAIFRFKAGMIQTLAACSALGVLLYLSGALSFAAHM